MPQNGPYILNMKPGSYVWCACGLSKKGPFCDGSHASTTIRPIMAYIEDEQVVSWCGCKMSSKKPFCDGTHNKILPREP